MVYQRRKVSRCRQEIGGAPDYENEPCISCENRFFCITNGKLKAVSNDVGYIFEVPNNKEGQEFRRLAKKFIVPRRWEMKWRGRKEGMKHDIRVEDADYWAVYIIMARGVNG